jgi:hypothetical protein
MYYSEEELPTLLFVQLKRCSYCCGKTQHKLPNCRKKNKIPKAKWMINKLQMVQAKENTKEISAISWFNSNSVKQQIEKSLHKVS